MVPNDRSSLKTGDWIKGTSWDGELILGFIESMDILEGVVKVTVIRSDNTETIGKTIPILSKQVKKLPVSTATNKEQTRFLIDLALSTGDEEWFMELTAKLKEMKQLVSTES
ncbi:MULTISPECIES: IDEAL domain-containing protein [Neobacillus]|uniref:IDEAL domain-containing protein n=1 Tax=Neobacillus rhizophilus TaxID=2833579 RepID=A0A942YYQ4_9BACI|nr:MULTISPECIES: IDEAL domain-containing protein [Neobacillus]MBS4215251.1 IDEAL domain-containing protein [Neobacillus rhizophilus]MBU8920176.1 IDEAL domain-containing protein [Bacillus sp. FJAT-29953]